MLSQSLAPYGAVMHEFYENARRLLESIPVPTVSASEREAGIPGVSASIVSYIQYLKKGQK